MTDNELSEDEKKLLDKTRRDLGVTKEEHNKLMENFEKTSDRKKE